MTSDLAAHRCINLRFRRTGALSAAFRLLVEALRYPRVKPRATRQRS
jgi:hypothetical protein